MGTVRQIELDRFILPSILMYNKDPVLNLVDWRDLTSQPQHTFSVEYLPDIGKHVRDMLIDHGTNDSQILMLMRYSMPYIKHNRLAFFTFEQVRFETLQILLRLQLATCLGLYSEGSKKPVWGVRVRLVAMFLKLLATGSPMDMYIFCSTHIALLRLSLIEYYIYFVDTNMPVETRLQHRLFGSESSPETTFRNIRCIIDSFRQTQFQDTELNWKQVCARSQAAVERCNRSCRGMPKPGARCAVPSTADPAITRLALKLPRHSVEISDLNCLRRVMRAHAVQDIVQIYALPFNAVYEQSLSLRRHVKTNTVAAVNACFMYVCLQCTNNVPDKSLRTGTRGAVVCGSCQEEDYIVKINLLGRIVSIHTHKFYLCPFCVRVHRWTGTGHELTSCSICIPTHIEEKGCRICTHTNSSNSVHVLDSHLGAMQRITLCNRHMPYEHQLRYVHDIESLVVRIQKKFAK